MLILLQASGAINKFCEVMIIIIVSYLKGNILQAFSFSSGSYILNLTSFLGIPYGSGANIRSCLGLSIQA